MELIPSRMMTDDVMINYRVTTQTSSYNLPTTEVQSASVKGYFRPRRSYSVIDGGETLVSDAMVILNPDTDVENIESIVVHDTRFQLDGEPLPHWNPTTKSVQYYAIYLRRGAA